MVQTIIVTSEVTKYVNLNDTGSNTLMASVGSDHYKDATVRPFNEVTNYVNPNGTFSNNLTSLGLFPSLAGMSHTKLSLGGNNYIFSGQGEFG